MTTLRALHSSQKHDWRTPEPLLDRVRALDIIGLDPCADEDHHFAETNLTAEDDGLSQPWTAHGLVFVNPPYGRALGAWLDKAIAEAERGAELVLLCPARTDTRWYHRARASANGRAFIQGRLTFVGAPSAAPFPSMLWYWGADPWMFCSAFRDMAEVGVL